jgi:YVTN family beta-propeller protein
MGIAVNSHTHRVFVGDYGSSAVSVIKGGHKSRVVATIPVGAHPFSVSADEKTDTVYAADIVSPLLPGTVAVISQP